MTRRFGILLLLLASLIFATSSKRSSEAPVDPSKSEATLKGEAVGRLLLPVLTGVLGLYLVMRKKRSSADDDTSSASSD